MKYRYVYQLVSPEHSEKSLKKITDEFGWVKDEVGEFMYDTMTRPKSVLTVKLQIFKNGQWVDHPQN